jgi:hypothetical protein
MLSWAYFERPILNLKRYFEYSPIAASVEESVPGGSQSPATLHVVQQPDTA